MKRFLIFALGLCLLYSCARTTQAEIVLLDFTAGWCGPCQTMAPTINRLEREGVKIRRIDYDQNVALAKRYKVKNLPCYVAVDDGKEIGRIVGVTSFGKLHQICRINAHQGRYRAVVRVIALDSGNSRSLGSGCVIRWGKRLVIITARHVVRGAKRVFVRGKIRMHECKVLGGDTDWDVVVLMPSQSDDGDFDPASIAWGRDGTPRRGQSLETCGYGSDNILVVNRGTVVGFGRYATYKNIASDWVQISGKARGGDSGGPVFNERGELVGVLWGTNNEIVVATQCGRLHKIIGYVLGPYPRLVKQMNYIISRPVVPVNRPKTSIQVGLFRNGPLLDNSRCGPGGCRPQQPSPVPQQPSINVQADPRVGNALMGIDTKLDVVVQNTTPLEIEPEPEDSKQNPLILIGVLAGGVVLGFIGYFSSRN